MSFAYLAVLLVSAAGVLTVDLRFKLFLWAEPRRAAAVLVAAPRSSSRGTSRASAWASSSTARART